MKMIHLGGVLLAGLAVAGFVKLGSFGTAGEPKRAANPALEQDEDVFVETVKAIDERAKGRPDAGRAEAFARQYKVDRTVVDDLRRDRLGWGEIAMRLALAEQLSAIDPEAYPSTPDALKRIDALRLQNKSWGTIAKELGLKLGLVVRRA